jgi:hypothetical protein
MSAPLRGTMLPVIGNLSIFAAAIGLFLTTLHFRRRR